jgi:hypothetical protein
MRRLTTPADVGDAVVEEPALVAGHEPSLGQAQAREVDAVGVDLVEGGERLDRPPGLVHVAARTSQYDAWPGHARLAEPALDDVGPPDADGAIEFAARLNGIARGGSGASLAAVGIRRNNTWQGLLATAPWIIVVINSVLAGVVAGLVPAHRASRVDPIVALRYE